MGPFGCQSQHQEQCTVQAADLAISKSEQDILYYCPHSLIQNTTQNGHDSPANTLICSFIFPISSVWCTNNLLPCFINILPHIFSQLCSIDDACTISLSSLTHTPSRWAIWLAGAIITSYSTLPKHMWAGRTRVSCKSRTPPWIMT